MIDYLQLIKNFYIILIKILKLILFIKFLTDFHFLEILFQNLVFNLHLEELVKFDQIWINEKVKKYFNKNLKKNYSVLEYGCGSSSFFFSKRVKKVLSIEHDKSYFYRVKELNKKLKTNINFKLIEPKFNKLRKIYI